MVHCRLGLWPRHDLFLLCCHWGFSARTTHESMEIKQTNYVGDDITRQRRMSSDTVSRVSKRPPGAIDRLVASTRYLSSRQYKIGSGRREWYSPSLGVIVMVGAIWTFVMGMSLNFALLSVVKFPQLLCLRYARTTGRTWRWVIPRPSGQGLGGFQLLSCLS